MELLSDPNAWLSFLTLSVLEIVLGIDNILFLTLLVERLPREQQRSARLLGLSFAMLTRLALLFALVWLAGLRRALFTLAGREFSLHDLILFGGGVFLIVQSARAIFDPLGRHDASRRARSSSGFWMIIVQAGLLDIVFSLDTVLTAIGLAKHVEVMVAAIVVSLPAMMAVASAFSGFIKRYPRLKTLALAFLVLVGISLAGQSLHAEIPQGYLYFAMAFAAAVEWINIRLRPRG